jgi:hypothetical protein
MRRLYSDLDLVLVGGYRTVIITGVHNAVTEPDLAEFRQLESCTLRCERHCFAPH